MVRVLSLVPLVLALGCRAGPGASAPVEGHLELCCKAASEDNVFVGCRATGYCRAAESVWVRGPLSCGPQDPEECAGGRCCVLELDDPDSPQLDADSNESGTKKEPTAEAPRPAPPPDPLPITPVDWQTEPSAPEGDS